MTDLDDLFAGPLAEFVARRDALAKALKEEGDPEASAAVKSTKKPTVSAWVVNQLAHHHPDAVHDLIEAGEQLEEAQRATLAGRAGDSGDARNAEAEAIEHLRETARSVMDDITPATLERVTNSLLAGARWAGGRQALMAGHLTKDLEPPGFDAYAGFTVASAPKPTPKPKKKQRPRVPKTAPAPDPPAQPDPLAQQLDSLREARVEAARASEKAEAHARSLEAKAAEAKRQAETLQLRAVSARQEADAAAERLAAIDSDVTDLSESLE